MTPKQLKSVIAGAVSDLARIDIGGPRRNSYVAVYLDGRTSPILENHTWEDGQDRRVVKVQLWFDEADSPTASTRARRAEARRAYEEAEFNLVEAGFALVNGRYEQVATENVS